MSNHTSEGTYALTTESLDKEVCATKGVYGLLRTEPRRGQSRALLIGRRELRVRKDTVQCNFTEVCTREQNGEGGSLQVVSVCRNDERDAQVVVA